MSFFLSLLNAMPGAITQGMLWGIMAIGVYITYRILDVADLTVDGSLATGGAVCVMLMRAGWNPWAALLCAFLAGVLAGLCTGLLHTRCGIPAILAGILTQLALYSVNLRIMTGKANQPIGVDKYDLLVSQRYVRDLALNNPIPLVILFLAVLIGLLYWFFGIFFVGNMAAGVGFQFSLHQLDAALAAGTVTGAGSVDCHIGTASQLQKVIADVAIDGNGLTAFDLKYDFWHKDNTFLFGRGPAIRQKLPKLPDGMIAPPEILFSFQV